jgi:pSer/pThr/pTyr-binding forkhead associated (FHA) protein
VITLTVLSGPDAGQVFTFDGVSTVIGRSSACDLLLHDSSLGRRHCEIRQEQGKIVLADLGSVNGTFVNEQEERITTYTLNSRDEIRLGKSLLRIEFPQLEEAHRPLPPPSPPPVEAKPSPPPQRREPAPPRPSPTPPVQEPPRAQVPPAPSPPSDEATVVGPSPSPAPPRLLLRVLEGADAGITYELPPTATRVTVGRGQTANFILKDLRVSRIHFTIEQTPTGFVLIDGGSLNGTFLNDNTERTQRATLRHGDIIILSDTRLQVEIPAQGERTSFAPRPPRSPSSPPARPRMEREVSLPSSSPPPPVAAPITISLPSRWQTVLVAFLFVAMGSGGLLVWGKPTFLASGPLTAGHAQWEGECATCHPAWGSQAIHTTCAAADCHANVLQTNTQHQDQCLSCHTEHRGRTFDLRGNASQCWSCHDAAFRDRPLWRYYQPLFVASGPTEKRTVRLVPPATENALRQWQHSTRHDETGLIFGHAIHAKSSGQSACLACHEPFPGTVINALSAGSAFPTHEDCIECHAEVGDRDPRRAADNTSAQCRKCHAREDHKVLRLPRTLQYVEFSHDNHKATNCIECHFTIPQEQTYRPAIRSAVYPLPMDKCLSCHQQEQAKTSCLTCHRAHHATLPVTQPEAGMLMRINLPQALGVLLALEAGLFLGVYWLGRES